MDHGFASTHFAKARGVQILHRHRRDEFPQFTTCSVQVFLRISHRFTGLQAPLLVNLAHNSLGYLLDVTDSGAQDNVLRDGLFGDQDAVTTTVEPTCHGFSFSRKLQHGSINLATSNRAASVPSNGGRGSHNLLLTRKTRQGLPTQRPFALEHGKKGLRHSTSP